MQFINMKQGILDILLKLGQHYIETAYAINLSTYKHSFPIHVLKRDVMKSFHNSDFDQCTAKRTSFLR